MFCCVFSILWQTLECYAFGTVCAWRFKLLQALQQIDELEFDVEDVSASGGEVWMQPHP